MILVSVIVPVYNVEAYLRHCLDTVLGQTYPHLQIIVVDDGSTDRSGQICDEYAARDGRITVIHKENGGLADARNAGLEQATGDYIAFVDSDDWLEPDYVEVLLNGCETNGAQAAICRYAERWDEVPYEHREEESYNAVWTGREAVECRIRRESEFHIGTSVCNKLYRKEVIADLQFPKGRYYEDIVYSTAALLNADRVAYSARILYHYRQKRAGSIMTQGFNARIVTDELPLMSERNRLIRAAGMADTADLIDRNYCIRVIEIYRELYNSRTIEQKEALYEQCEQWFDTVYRRCSHRYFRGIDPIKVFLFRRNKKFCMFLLNKITRKNNPK